VRNFGKPGVVLGIIAVALAGSGSAVAANAITGKDVKNGSLTGADVKNRSLSTSDLSTAAISSLKGQTGATGATGASGATGATGPAGAPAPSVLGSAPLKGEAGAKGDTGAKGETGPAGEDGAAGTAGPAGLKGEKGDAGSAGVKGDKGEAGPSGLEGAFYSVAYYDKGDTNEGAIATVSCDADDAASQGYIAISGGVQTIGVGDSTPVASSFPGRMEWSTNTPKPGRLDGWIVQFAGAPGKAPHKVKVWALCIKKTTDVPVKQTYTQSAD
jgi:hypothetical protein